MGAWDDRPAEEWRRFPGRVNRRWQDLASALERRLTAGLGIPKAALARLKPELAYAAPSYGTEGIARCVVRWHDPVQDEEMRGTGLEGSGALAAEFDLQTGDLKYIAFYDLALLALSDAAGGAKRARPRELLN